MEQQINTQIIERIVPDTSVIIEGLLSEKLRQNHLKSSEIIIHEAVIAELEHQANLGKAIGFLGLDEIKRIKKLSSEKQFELSFKGSRPKAAEIRHASLGEIDSLIRQLAFDEDATLITSDKVQSEVALAKGMKVIYYKRPEKGLRKLKLERFFDETTMSVHLRENVPPYAKKGMPGNWEFKELRKALLKQEEIQEMSREIIEDAKLRKDGFIEIERTCSTIVQLGVYRIVITRPPFSDGWEITAVRPVKRLSLNDYKLSDKLMTRIAEQAEGVLVAGAPGMGKCIDIEHPIFSENGPIKVKELINLYNFEIKRGNPKELYIPKNDINVYTLNKDGQIKLNNLQKIIIRKEHKLIEVITQTGKSIRVSEEHPFLTFGKEGIKWLNVKGIKIGNLVATPMKINHNGKPQFIDLTNLMDQNKTFALLNVNLDFNLEIFRKFNGYKRDIVKILFDSSKASRMGLLTKIKISKSRLTKIISELIEDNVILRDARGIYSLKLRFWKPKKYEWISFGDLKYLKNKYNLDQVDDYVDKIKVIKSNKKSLAIKPVWQTSPELHRILSYLYSEGLTKFGISNKDSNLLNDFFNCTEKVFGVRRDCFKNRKIDYYIDNSATLDMFFDKAFNYRSKIKNKSFKIELPEILFNSSVQEIKNFLRAYFEAEGSVDVKNHEVELTSASNKLIKQMATLLLIFGVVARVKPKPSFAKNSTAPKPKIYYRLRISGAENLKNFDDVGFLFKNKNAKLDLIINKKANPNIGVLPAGRILHSICKILKYYPIKGYEKNSYSIIRLNKIYNILLKFYRLNYINNNGINHEVEQLLAQIKVLIDSQIFWDKVIDKKELNGNFEVFDLEVKDSHNFIAGEIPVIVHNTTFAQALAEYYASQNKVVKTVEAPRDLILPERITQYAISYGDAQEIHDILLLSRPDYTIFDEMRNTDDFKLFADLRLAGVGMVGVVHATSPVDAIQRFIGRVEMGVIPQVIDTVIFIKNGFINKVLALKMTVKVPSGMTEADLARPVVVVNDFETGRLEYEIYSYGEQTVVIPVQESRERKSGAHKLAETTIIAEFQKYSRNVEVEMLSDNKCIVYVPETDIARIIGKQGSNIMGLEKKLGIGIDIKSIEEKYSSGIKGAAKEGKEIPFEINYKKNNLMIELGMDMQNRDVDIYVNEEFVLSAKAGKTGLIKIKKSNNIGRRLMEALNRKEKIRLVV